MSNTHCFSLALQTGTHTQTAWRHRTNIPDSLVFFRKATWWVEYTGWYTACVQKSPIQTAFKAECEPTQFTNCLPSLPLNSVYLQIVFLRAGTCGCAHQISGCSGPFWLADVEWKLHKGCDGEKCMRCGKITERKMFEHLTSQSSRLK